MGVSSSKRVNPSGNTGLNSGKNFWEPEFRWMNYDGENPSLKMDGRDDITQFFNTFDLLTHYEKYQYKVKVAGCFLVIQVADSYWLLLDKVQRALFVYRSAEKQKLLGTRDRSATRPEATLESSGIINDGVTLMELFEALRDEAKVPFSEVNSDSFCDRVLQKLVSAGEQDDDDNSDSSS